MLMRKSMQPNSKKMVIIGLALGVFLSFAKPVSAAAGEIEITEDRAKACAKAEKRYAKLYPEAKKDGTVIVKLYKYNFCPANVTIKSGTTVRWVNVDKRTSHSVWLKQAKIDESERFFPEEIWEFTFVSPGKYPYLCGPHWKDEGMRGFVNVES